GDLGGVNVREGLGVRWGADGYPHVDVLHKPLEGGVAHIKLLVAGILVENLVRTAQRHAEDDVPARLQHALVNGKGQRLSQRLVQVNHDQVARLDGNGVVDHHLCDLLDSWVHTAIAPWCKTSALKHNGAQVRPQSEGRNSR